MLVNYMFFGTNLGLLSPELQYLDVFAFSGGEQLLNLLVIAVLAVVMYLLVCRFKKAAVMVLLTAAITVSAMSAVNIATVNTAVQEALSRRDVLLLGIFMDFATIAANGITTYLPQFLHTVRGFTEEAASSIVGVASGISAAANIFGGFATTLLGKRKIIIVPTYVLSITFLTLALSFSGAGMISGMFIAYTIFSNMRNPASQTISTELKNVTPALTSSAAAISFGIGFIGTFFASPLLQLSISIFGEARQMLIYIPLFLSSFTAIICMPETGPGRKSKA
jgi:predicted MFS family arabinose efflux permease